MHGGWVAVILEEKFVHQRGNFRKTAGRRGIIEINVSFFIHKSTLLSVMQESSTLPAIVKNRQALNRYIEDHQSSSKR
jgi:hypothetical protein